MRAEGRAVVEAARWRGADHGIAYRAIRDDLGDLEALRGWALGKLDAGEP